MSQMHTWIAMLRRRKALCASLVSVIALTVVGMIFLLNRGPSLPKSPTVVVPAVAESSWVHGGGRQCSECHVSEETRQERRELESVIPQGEGEAEKGGEEEGEGGADNRASLFIGQRAYPKDSIPFGARYEAYLQALKLVNPRPASWERWENIGPAPMKDSTVGGVQINVSGRVTALAVDPRDSNVAYVGAALGGVWKTTNAGASWTPLTDNQASLATGDIAIDPTNPNIIYVGTGEAHGSDSYYGAGLLKSTNGGQSWTLLGANEFAWAGITRVIVDPRNPQTIYVATANYTGVNVTPPRRPWAGIFKSTNGGSSWARLLGCEYNNGQCLGASDLVMNVQNTQVLYAAFWGTGIYKTTDGGVRWEQIDRAGSDIKRIELAISRSNPAVLYAGYSKVASNYRGIVMIKSTDGGASWAVISRAPNYCGQQCNYDNIIEVHPNDPNAVYVGGSANYIWEPVWIIKQVLQMSPDGGNTWRDLSPGDRTDRVLHPDMHVITFDPRDPNIIWVGNDGGVRRSTNGGQTWQDANGNLATLQFTGVAAHPTDPNTAYGGMQDNNKAKTTGSIVWQALDAGDGGFAAIDPFDPRYYYGTRYYLQYQRNDKSGSAPVDDWPVKVSGINQNDQMLFYSPFALDPSTPGVLYWGTDRLYRTTNRGDRWQAISNNLTKSQSWLSAISAIAVAPSSPAVIYVGTGDGNVQVTTNTGSSWSNVTKAPLPNRFVSDIAVVHGSPQTAYVVYNGFDEHTPSTRGHVFKTTNYGGSWQNISSNLPNIPALAIALDRDAPATIYIGTDIGVFRSQNDGTSWELLNNGMANVAVTDLALNPNTDVLLAATHGRSIYRLKLGAAPKLHFVNLPLSLKDFRQVVEKPGTPTRTATPVHSLPTATATRYVNPTPTSPPPTPSGAVTTFVDDFENSASGWYQGAQGACQYMYQNGEYVIGTNGTNWICWSVAPAGSHPDGIFEVTARQGGEAIYGLIFGASDDYEDYYAFFVRPDQGQYALLLRYFGAWSSLRGWTASAAIATGSAPNQLRVMRSGSTIGLFINEQQVASIEDSSLLGSGYVGLANWSLSGLTFSFFDDFEIASPVNIAVSDNFSNPNSGWARGSSEDGYCSADYANGEYAFTTSADAACYSIAPTYPYPDGIYEVTARRAESTYPTAYGIMFAVDWSPPSEYYLFWINPDSRTFCLLEYDGIDLYGLIDWTFSNAINPGSAPNRLRVIRDGVQMHLFVNDTYLVSYTDDALLDNGYLALINWASPYEPITSYFDDFRVFTWDAGGGKDAGRKLEAGEIGSPPQPIGPFKSLDKLTGVRSRGVGLSVPAPK